MIAPGYKVINNDCPEGATSSGRSPGRGVDSYMFDSENFLLTFSDPLLSCFYVEKQVPFRIEEDGLSDNVFKDSTNL